MAASANLKVCWPQIQTALQVGVLTCLPPPSALTWLAAHAAALYFEPCEIQTFFEELDKQPRLPYEAQARRMTQWQYDWVVGRCGAPHAGGLYTLAPRPDTETAPLSEQRMWADELTGYCSPGYERDLLRLLSNGEWVARGTEGASEEPGLGIGPSVAQLRRLVLALPTFSQLRLLSLKQRVTPHDSQEHIDTLPFAGMPRLEVLVLEGCGDVDLRGLPPSLRTLRVSAQYRQGQYMNDNPPGTSLAIPQGRRCAWVGAACSGAVPPCPGHACPFYCCAALGCILRTCDHRSRVLAFCRLASAVVVGYAMDPEEFDELEVRCHRSAPKRPASVRRARRWVAPLPRPGRPFVPNPQTGYSRSH